MKKVKYYFSIVLILCIVIGLLPVRVHAASEIVTSSDALAIHEMISEKSESIEEGIAEIRASFEAKKGWLDTIITMIKEWFNDLWMDFFGANKTYTVTFMYNYGDKEVYKVMTVNEGESLYLGTAPSRSGYTFEGWFIDETGKAEYDFSAEITEDVVLFAKWLDNSTKELWLSASKEKLLTNDDDTIRFYVDTEIVADVIYLFDISSEKLCVAEMYDDGLFDEHGDDMAGDGIYSTVLTEVVWEDKVVSYVAEYGSDSSNVVDIEYYTPVSDSTLEAMEVVDKKIIDLVNSAQFENLSDKEKKNSANDLLNELIEKDLIVDETVCYNEEKKLYSFEYAEGILGGILLDEFDTDFNGTASDIAFYMSNSAVYNVPLTDYINGDIGNAIILNSFPSFETEERKIRFRTDFYEELKQVWDSKGLLTALDTEVTISDYKMLKDYDVVCISTHGSTYEWNDGFLWLQHHEYPAICLSEKVTWEKNKLYSLELKDKQIVKVNGCYWLLPSFFENAYDADALSGTFIFAECCQFMGRNGNYDYSMSEALLSRSVPAVVGFHNSVYAEYSRDFMATYVNSLIAGDYVSEAYDAAKLNNGANHKVWYEGIYGAYDAKVPIAYPVLSGEGEATLIQNGIINGDFELYDFMSTAPKSWSMEGDVRTLSQLGDVKSIDTSSKRMAIITTGVGSKTTATVGAGTEGSSISQRFLVPEDATTLSFEYNFISEEPMEYVGSEFNDSFGILIKQNDIIMDEYTYESINSSLWYEVKNIDFDGGDDTVYQTGWKNAEVDISAYRGKIITFYFMIYDVGDSIYDSACVIDNVILK